MSLYPWSQRRLTYTTSTTSPFPRYGAAVNATGSKEGDIYVMGGLINSQNVKGDLWMIEAGGNMSCYELSTTAEGPSPRVGHASLLVGNAFIVYGGDTKIDENDILDETLYLLNTCMSPPTLILLHLIPPAVTNMLSNETMVQSTPVGPATIWPLRPLAQHPRLQDLHLWWPGRGLLHERSCSIRS